MPWPRSASFVPAVAASSSRSVRSTVRGRRGPSSAVASASRFSRARGSSCSRSGRIFVRIRPRFVASLELSSRYGRPAASQYVACLLGPEVEQRPDDAVLALRLDPAGPAARDEPIEDGLDLVGGRVPGRAQAIGRERVADAPQLVLGARGRGVDDLGPEQPRGRRARPRRTPLRAGRGSRAARRRGSRARRGRARGRSSRRRPRRGRSRRRRARSAGAGGSAGRRARGRPSGPLFQPRGARHVPGTDHCAARQSKQPPAAAQSRVAASSGCGPQKMRLRYEIVLRMPIFS